MGDSISRNFRESRTDTYCSASLVWLGITMRDWSHPHNLSGRRVPAGSWKTNTTKTEAVGLLSRTVVPVWFCPLPTSVLTPPKKVWLSRFWVWRDFATVLDHPCLVSTFRPIWIVPLLLHRNVVTHIIKYHERLMKVCYSEAERKEDAKKRLEKRLEKRENT